MRLLWRVFLTGFILASIFVHHSHAAVEPLVAALDAYEKAVVDKLNLDLETIARGFADARDIQKARRWADWAKIPLDTISLILTIPKDPASVVRELGKAENQIQLLSGLFKLHTLSESAQGLKLAIRGPEYNEAVTKMLAEADGAIDKGAYQDTILLYLHGLSGRKSPAPIVIETERGKEALSGVKEFKARLRALLDEIKAEVAALPGLPEDQLKKLVEEIEVATLNVKRSKSRNVELGGGVTLGRINPLELVRADALTRYDQDMKIEQVNTIASTVASVCVVTSYYLTGGMSIGTARHCVPISGGATLLKAVTLGYQTSARRQVDELPFEMLLSLPGEAASLWKTTQELASRITKAEGPPVIGVWRVVTDTGRRTWSLHADHRVEVSTNTGFRGYSWSLSNKVFRISKPGSTHTWTGVVNRDGTEIKGTHNFSYEHKGKTLSRTNKWTAKKVTDDPNKLVDLYMVCRSKNEDISSCKNVGKKEQCHVFLARPFQSALTLAECKKVCIAGGRCLYLERYPNGIKVLPPPLPAPKILAKSPRVAPATVTAEPTEALIQLPTSQSSAVESPQLKVQTPPGATVSAVSEDELKLLKGAVQGMGLPAVEGSPSAIQSPDFAPYIEMLQRKVQSVWQYPEGISGRHQVKLSFALDRKGRLVLVEVLHSTDPKLNSSAIRAMKRASPFPKIPETLKDLAGWPIHITFTIEFGVLGEPDTSKWAKWEAEEKKKQARIEAERARMEAEKARIAKLRAEKEAERKKRLNDFVRKYRVKELVSASSLDANPFVYQGKVVAIYTDFKRMVSPDTGVFGDGAIIVSGVPRDLFRSRGVVVIAGRVMGRKDQAPHLKFVGVHFCKEWGCSDILPQR